MNKGQSILSVVMWAGGISLSAALGSFGFFNSMIEKTDAKASEAVRVNSEQTTSIELLKQSACVQNQNIAAIGKALKVNVVSDTNCK